MILSSLTPSAQSISEVHWLPFPVLGVHLNTLMVTFSLAEMLLIQLFGILSKRVTSLISSPFLLS